MIDKPSFCVSRRKLWGNKICIKELIQIIFWLARESFKLLPKNSQQSCQNSILRIQRMNSRKIFYLEVYSSPTFPDSEQKFSDFYRIVLCRIINYAFYVPKVRFWEKLMSEIGASHSGTSSDKRCGSSLESFSVGLSKTNPTCPDDPIWEKHFLNFYFLSLLLDYEQTFFRNSTESLRAGLPKLPSTFSELFEGKKYFLARTNFSHQFLTLSWWLTGLGKKLPGVLKAAFSVSGVTFCLKTVLEEKVQHFCIFNKRFPVILVRNCRLGCQTFLLRVHKNNLMKKIGEKSCFNLFLDFGKEIYKLLPKSSQQGCQNSILRIQKMNSKKEMVSESTEFSSFPRLRAELFGL